MGNKFFRLDDDWYLKAQSSLTNSELRILLFVAMNINGFNQSPVNISHSLIGKIIDMKRPHVSSALKSLVEKDWLKSSQKGYSLKNGILKRKGTDFVPYSDIILDSNGTDSVQISGTDFVHGTNSVHDRYGFRTCDGTDFVPVLSYSKELIDKSINKNKEEKENRRKPTLSPFFPYSKYPDIDCVLIQDLKSKFDLLWGCWLNTRRGTIEAAKDSYERMANETGLNEFADRLEIAFGMYMRSDEWDKEIIKSLPNWLKEYENWYEEYQYQVKNKKTKPLEKGKTWERMKEHVEFEKQ